MKILKYILITILVIAGLFGIFLIYSTIDDYQPPESEVILDNQQAGPLTDSDFTAVTWNLGYGGLDSSMDFFYDGGKQVRPSREQAKKNVEGILKQLKTFGNPDFINLQEVDKSSKRSYRIDMVKKIADLFSGWSSSFGMNYKVDFVPLPPRAPMGKVRSGIQSLSKATPHLVTRFSFPGNYSWPVKLFMLDRCFLESRYWLNDGKELVVINTHNSAYDDGSLRKQQMEYLKDHLIGEYEKGNYVVVGGDWNQTPAGFEPQFAYDVFDSDNLTYIPGGYPAGDWKWAFDPTIPSNRRVITPYKRGTTPTTVIDCFLVSPNITVEDVHGLDLGFEYSDHQPVFFTFRIQ